LVILLVLLYNFIKIDGKREKLGMKMVDMLSLVFRFDEGGDEFEVFLESFLVSEVVLEG